MSGPLSVEELRGRVAALTGPSREVDCAIALDVGGWRCKSADDGTYWRRGDFSWTREDWEHPPAFTDSVDAVLGLIERKLPGWAWYVSRGSGVGILPSSAMVWNIDGDGPEEQFAPTPALALLLALLASLQSQEP
jgi:hypothetical protein